MEGRNQVNSREHREQLTHHNDAMRLRAVLHDLAAELADIRGCETVAQVVLELSTSTAACERLLSAIPHMTEAAQGTLRAPAQALLLPGVERMLNDRDARREHLDGGAK